MNNRSILETITGKIFSAINRNRLPVFSSLFTGFAAYMFCFTNKLETMDDLAGMYGQGATLSSGRWGLDILKYFMPNFSFPWLNGLLSLLLITISICFVIEIFEIRSRVLQIVLPAVLISFPSQICTYGYMFTTVQYAYALFSAIFGVFLLTRGKSGINVLCSALCFVFTMSIYQAFIAVAASYLVVYVIFLVIEDSESEKRIVRKGLGFVGILAVSMIAYYGITILIQRILGTDFNEYGKSTLNGISDIFFGIRVAYTSFFGFFIKGYYDLMPTVFSRIIHIVIAVLVLLLIVVYVLSKQDRAIRRGKVRILLICFLLLPPAVNCLRIISSLTHNLMLFSVTAVYVLAAVVVQHAAESGKIISGIKDTVCLGIAVIVCVNVLYANGVYFKMYMQEKQAESFYTGIVSALMKEKGFQSDSRVAFVGSNDVLYPIPMINTDNLVGIREGIVGTYSQQEFLRTFLGLQLNVCGNDVTDFLREDERVLAMPSYPYYGCIQELDGIYVVKLG